MRNIYKLSCLLLLSSLNAYAQEDSAFVKKEERQLNLGYGVTVKASESSAAISEITGEELMKSAATNPLNGTNCPSGRRNYLGKYTDNNDSRGEYYGK